MILQAIHRAATGLLHLERRFDPFVRPGFDFLFQAPLAALVQALIRRKAGPPAALGEETKLADEDALVDAIIADMVAYMRTQYVPGRWQRGGNTKTHGVVRATFTVAEDLPPAYRHGVFATPRAYPTWVRFAGPGPDSPPDIEDVGVLSIGMKLMDVPGAKLLDDEARTQDFTGISTPIFTTPDVRENAKLQAAVRAGLPLFYFFGRDPHILDALMQGLWARTQTSPLETAYWGCVPYRLGPAQAMQYMWRPRRTTRSRVPRLPLRPPDDYLRETLAATLAGEDASFDLLVQLQTDPARMPIENASVRWPFATAQRVGTLHIPSQAFDSLPQRAFAGVLSFNPWHALEDHRPLGNQNRARLRIYTELSRLRQGMNGTPHVEPTGEERF